MYDAIGLWHPVETAVPKDGSGMLFAGSPKPAAGAGLDVFI
jgi:hypothetical protein